MRTHGLSREDALAIVELLGEVYVFYKGMRSVVGIPAYGGLEDNENEQ